jgi:hypothetical protein
MKYPDLRFPNVDITEKAVVRPHEKMFARFDRNSTPGRADAGIDDRQVNSSRWKVVIAGPKRICG